MIHIRRKFNSSAARGFYMHFSKNLMLTDLARVSLQQHESPWLELVLSLHGMGVCS